MQGWVDLCYVKLHQLGFEPTTYHLQVQHATAAPPIHLATPVNCTISRRLRQWCLVLSQVTDHTQRLGCAEAGGYAALKAHKFFDGTEWGSLHLQNAPELHPFLPANSEDSVNLWSQYTVLFSSFVLSVLWSCWLGGRKNIQPIRKLSKMPC